MRILEISAVSIPYDQYNRKKSSQRCARAGVEKQYFIEQIKISYLVVEMNCFSKDSAQNSRFFGGNAARRVSHAVMRDSVEIFFVKFAHIRGKYIRIYEKIYTHL